MSDKEQRIPKEPAGAMSLRDYFAGRAMGWLDGPHLLEDMPEPDALDDSDLAKMQRLTRRARTLARAAYVLADAMMDERTKGWGDD